VILVCMVVGEAAGRIGDPYYRALKAAWVAGDAGGFLDVYRERHGELGWGDLRLPLFALALAAWLVVARGAVLAFLRSLTAGVALVAWTVIAVSAGILVPQIENFEDPEQRVGEANRERLFADFAWAEGQFAWHLLHLYGVGAPEAEIPEQAAAGLERYQRVYGIEERDNKEKQMREAFSGQAKSEEIQAFVLRHDRTLRRAFELCTALDLNRAYKSYWFATLMAVLAAAVAANLFKLPFSAWWSIHKLGFVLAHVGILVLLAGGLVSKLFTERGILVLDLRDPPNDVFYRHYNEKKPARLPFAVRLDHFGRQDWIGMQVHFPAEQFQVQPPTYTLWPGRTIDLDYVPDEDRPGRQRPGLRLVCRDLYDRAEVGVPLVSEDPAAEVFPLVDVEVATPRGEHDHADDSEGHDGLDARARGGRPASHRELYSPIGFNKTWVDPEGEFRVAVGTALAAPALFQGDPGRLGTLEVQVGMAQAEPEPIPLVVGRKSELPGGVSIEILRATRNFRLEQRGGAQVPVWDERPLAEQPHGVTAVEVEIQSAADGRSERRTLWEIVDPVEHGLQVSYPFREVVIRPRWDRWLEPGAPRYVLAWTVGEEPFLLSESGERWPVESGAPLPIQGGERFVPLQFVARPRLRKDVVLLPAAETESGFARAFYEPRTRGALIEVVRDPGTAGEQRELVEFATTDFSGANLWWADDGRFVLQVDERDDGFPYEWRSVLSIVEQDGDGRPYVVDVGGPEQREIRVNDYFTYGGYRFFQTDANKLIPTYSGIGVVYDPGIELVLAGMYVIIAGMVVAFLVRPIVLGARRGAASSSAEAGGAARS
jgi:hypothetical protein